MRGVRFYDKARDVHVQSHPFSVIESALLLAFGKSLWQAFRFDGGQLGYNDLQFYH
jgi:hypothetical protein